MDGRDSRSLGRANSKLTPLLACLIVACSESGPDGPAANGGSEGSTGGADAAAGGGSGGAMGGSGPGGTGPGGQGGTAGQDQGDPQYLSETGLYVDAQQETLADGVQEYQPRFELWSDGATKRRFIRLPEGSKIDNSDMDHWRYPIGTKIWKEFTRGDTRVETRLIEKRDDSLFGWFMMAYAWNAEQTQATAVPEGAENVLGTEHDIPSSIDCRTCHFGMPDKVLGFTALQLAHTDAGLTLQAAVEAGLLTEAPTDVELALPGTAVDQVALGYLHANCGHCHNPGGAGFERSNIELLLSSSELENVQDTAAYRTSVNVPLEVTLDGYSLRIDPGAPSSSGLLFRMGTRGEGAMPPLASELVHDAAVSDIDAWIRSLR